ncbi:MAG: TIM barrel protein [Acidobacteriaceae bacterium]|jgi:sugar phosphate isomerase/epimerase|nr:TIM barrel protein [Acidobacteriaceae bacterium]
MPLSRRALLAAGPLASLSAAPAQTASPNRRQPLAVSTYSFWHFRTERYSIEKVIQHAADIGFDGVEILHRQMADESPAYVTRLKRLAFERGLALPMLSIHQDFVFPEQADRDKNITHTVKCVELAARLGIPCVRLNSGRWKTIKSFDDLMKVKGDEPALPGFNEQNAIDWCIDSIRKCLPVCEREGITLALENHWGLTTNIDTLLKIHAAVNSPWLGINLDTGNYPGEPYPGIAKLAPKATIVQAKTYYGGGEWYTLDLDYQRIAGILKQAGFKGWVSLEMEGKADPLGAVQKSYDQLRAAFA